MNETAKEELTMNAVPKAVNYLIEEVAEILQMKVGTVRRLVNNYEIPHYIREHNIYFFEDELIKWIEDSKIKPVNNSYYYIK